MTSNQFARNMMLSLGFSEEAIAAAEARDAEESPSREHLAQFSVGDRVRLTDPEYGGGTATIEALDIDNEDNAVRVLVNEREAAAIVDSVVGLPMGPAWGHLRFERVEPEQSTETVITQQEG